MISYHPLFHWLFTGEIGDSRSFCLARWVMLHRPLVRPRRLVRVYFLGSKEISVEARLRVRNPAVPPPFAVVD